MSANGSKAFSLARSSRVLTGRSWSLAHPLALMDQRTELLIAPLNRVGCVYQAVALITGLVQTREVDFRALSYHVELNASILSLQKPDHYVHIYTNTKKNNNFKIKMIETGLAII